MVAGTASTGRQLVLHCCFHPPALLLHCCSPVRMAEVDRHGDDHEDDDHEDDDHEDVDQDGDVGLDCSNVVDESSQSA